MSKLSETLAPLKAWFQKNPKRGYVVIAAVVIVGFFMLPSSDQSTKQRPQKKEKPVIEAVEKAVDPRAVWSDNLTQKMNDMSETITKSLAEHQQKAHDNAEQLEQKIATLRQEIDQIKSTDDEKKSEAHEPPKATVIVQSNFVHLHREFTHQDKKAVEDYITSGAFARAVLLTGVVAETGTEAASTPQPILLRLVDFGIFSKGYLTPQIKEAIIIGSCYGNISSERAVCRLERLSLVNDQADIVERPVEGWLIGEDGRPGIKGDVIDKASDVTRMAVLNGILGGIAGFFQNQASAGIYPISPIAGQSKALTGLDALKSGASSGVGNALQKLADYAIKRAEQMSPVIVVGAGRVIDVVFRKGFQLKDVTPIDNSPLKAVTAVSSQSYGAAPNEGEAGQAPNQNRNMGYNQGVLALNNLDMAKGTM